MVWRNLYATSEVSKFIDNVEVLREGSFTSLGLAVSKCDEDLSFFY